MPYSLSTKATILKLDIGKLQYTGETNKAAFSQLQNVKDAMMKSNKLGEEQQMILLGALVFTKKRIKATYGALTPNGTAVNTGSELYKAINALDAIKELKAADDRVAVETFALRSFYEWYRATAYNGEDRKMENDYCKKELVHDTFEPLLNELAASSAPIDSSAYQTIRDNAGLVSAAKYSPVVKTEQAAQDTKKPSGWSISGFMSSMLWAKPKPAAKAEEETATKKAEAETAKQEATATHSL